MATPFAVIGVLVNFIVNQVSKVAHPAAPALGGIRHFLSEFSGVCHGGLCNYRRTIASIRSQLARE
jgi:hypothetical protein